MRIHIKVSPQTRGGYKLKLYDNTYLIIKTNLIKNNCDEFVLMAENKGFVPKLLQGGQIVCG